MKRLTALFFSLLMLFALAKPASASEEHVVASGVSALCSASEAHFPLYGVRGCSGANFDK